MKKFNEQSDRPASDGFLPPERSRILSPKNPDFWRTFQFQSVIERPRARTSPRIFDHFESVKK